LKQTVESVCVLLVGACTGPVFDRGYLRLLLLIGSFGVVFGFMMLSLCTEFWQAMLAQGFCIGLGGGMLFVPSVAILPTYFSTKIGLAIGLAAAGSSMGGESMTQYTCRSHLLIIHQVSSTRLSSTAYCPKSVSAGPFASSASWRSPPCSSPSS
jgi:MFS family permease